MAHVAKWKHDELEELTKLITENKVVGIAQIGGIPAPQMQKMRSNLRGNVTIRSSKNSLIYLAISNAEGKNKGISELKDYVDGQAAIIATQMNPFKLFGQLRQTRTTAPAKGGEIASIDIEVKAGDTPFKPGPIVGELQKVGIPAQIKEGKVVIKSDKVLVNKGDKIPRDVAQMLTRLEIFPIKLGITLNAVFEDGNLFKPDVLDIDIDQFRLKIHQASFNALTLALETAWVNKQTVTPLITKAHQAAFGLAVELGIINKETVKHIIAKTHRAMLALASKSKDAVDDDLKKMLT
ncbi:MAG: 50S ribosomal protein L10 [Candidatus Thermoplasmatota archaeon]|nr:50S ribosomal protein L10 [Candidatus Thermoplasmatota archaeon]